MRHGKFVAAFLAVLLFGGVRAGAQLYVGGSFGFGASNDQVRVRISPDVGFNLTNHFAAGARLSYESGVNRFGVTPYARLNILKRDNPVRILATLEAPFVWSSSYSSQGLYLRPGLSVRVSNNVRIEGHFGYFGWGSVTSGGSTTRGWRYMLGTETISLGIVIGL